jgi:energy-coupling factor transport system substrate-specific component
MTDTDLAAPAAAAPAVRNGPPPVLLYGLITLVGVAAFVYPFWLPADGGTTTAHSTDAPLVAAVIGLLVVATLALEVRRGTMNGATVALLAVLATLTGMLRLLDLPGGGSGLFFLAILAGVAFGARFGALLGLAAMATSALLTGGVGPWLPFQMLGLAWMAGGAGLLGRVTRRLPPLAEVVVIAVYAWVWGFVYGAILNLWFWPFITGDGPTAWQPGLGLSDTLSHYWAFYVSTSLAWDAAGATTNAVLILLTGRAVLRALRRFSSRLSPVVEVADPAPLEPVADGPSLSPGEDMPTR